MNKIWLRAIFLKYSQRNYNYFDLILISQKTLSIINLNIVEIKNTTFLHSVGNLCDSFSSLTKIKNRSRCDVEKWWLELSSWKSFRNKYKQNWKLLLIDNKSEQILSIPECRFRSSVVNNELIILFPSHSCIEMKDF